MWMSVNWRDEWTVKSTRVVLLGGCGWSRGWLYWWCLERMQEVYIFTSITCVYSSIVARTARTMGSDHDRAARLKEVLWSDRADKALKAKQGTLFGSA